MTALALRVRWSRCTEHPPALAVYRAARHRDWSLVAVLGGVLDDQGRVSRCAAAQVREEAVRA
jgi:hypothetical protein